MINKPSVPLFICFFASLTFAACSQAKTTQSALPPIASASTAPSAATPTPALAPDIPLAEFTGTSLSVPKDECKKEPKPGDYAGLVQSVVATDDHTVTFTLCRPDPDFHFRLAWSAFGIHPSEWIEATASEGSRTNDGLEHPIGTGPYMFQEWKRGESLTLAANPNYWGEPPLAKTLTFLWNPDPAARLASLQAGIVDGIDSPSLADFETMRGDSLLTLIERSSLDAAGPDFLQAFAPLKGFADTPSAAAYRSDVVNPQASPFGLEQFHLSAPGDRDTFIWMQATEPPSLFCADESDVDTLRACAQIFETLYRFDLNSAAPVPALAESCEPNQDKTVWTCALRAGVPFHDGSDFDAYDVLATFNMGLNTVSPFHTGRVNQWEYYNIFWGLMKKPGGP